MNVDDYTALALLKVFSRLEFALKEFQEFLYGVAGQRPETQWSAYNRELRNDAFLARIEERHRAVLLGNPQDGPPPRKMFVDEERKIEFRDVPLEGAHTADKLMDAARRVRNNLIHGGKENGAQERFAHHDQRLAEAAISVMRAASLAHAGVAELCEAQA